MSASAIPLPQVSKTKLWLWQAQTIARAELVRNFITARGFWIYLLAIAPVVIVWLHSFITMRVHRTHPMANDTQIMAGLFQIFFLRPAVFFGCVGIFTYLIRGEAVERCLHYLFLAPVRREVVIVGKYIAGLITSCFFFCGSIALTFWGMYYHYPSQEVDYFMGAGGGTQHAFAYVGITALACMAYGALFLLTGTRYRNPVLPAVVLLIWESVNLFLPSWLQKISVLYYLRSMAPVKVNLFGVGAVLGAVAEPVSAWVAIPALFAITAVALVLACWQLRRTEISYSSD